MNRTGYEVLGFAVWHATKWYVRRRVRRAVPAPRTLAIGAVGALVVAAVVAEAGRQRSS
ncbi:MAG TPA: hypothetical protein VD931_17100 [Baekduia sp.]|nr:hypothetical protein [Baekduia sp.]